MTDDFNFQIDNRLYICEDIININDEYFVKKMNEYLLWFGPKGHGLAIRGGNNAINSLKPQLFLPELSAEKVSIFIRSIEESYFNDNDTDNKYDNENLSYSMYSEKVIIDGETVYSSG